MNMKQHQQVQREAKSINRFHPNGIASNNHNLRKIRVLDIHAQHISYLAGYIAKHIKSHEDVNGIVQDTLLEAIQAYGHFNAHSSEKTWLIGIAKHQIALYYRQMKNAISHLSLDDNIAIDNGNQEDEEYQAVRNEELFECFSILPKADQQILYWHAMDGLNHAKIGEKLGISERAVNMRISRARVALRRLCEKK